MNIFMDIFKAIELIKSGNIKIVEEYILNSNHKNKEGLIKTLYKMKYV